MRGQEVVRAARGPDRLLSLEDPLLTGMLRDIVVALTAQVGARLAARLVSAPSRMYGIAAAYPSHRLSR